MENNLYGEKEHYQKHAFLEFLSSLGNKTPISMQNTLNRVTE